jgi:hypothetical protein
MYEYLNISHQMNLKFKIIQGIFLHYLNDLQHCEHFYSSQTSAIHALAMTTEEKK